MRASIKRLFMWVAKQWRYGKQGAADTDPPDSSKKRAFNHFAKLALQDCEQMMTARPNASMIEQIDAR